MRSHAAGAQSVLRTAAAVQQQRWGASTEAPSRWREMLREDENMVSYTPLSGAGTGRRLGVDMHVPQKTRGMQNIHLDQRTQQEKQLERFTKDVLQPSVLGTDGPVRVEAGDRSLQVRREASEAAGMMDLLRPAGADAEQEGSAELPAQDVAFLRSTHCYVGGALTGSSDTLHNMARPSGLVALSTSDIQIKELAERHLVPPPDTADAAADRDGAALTGEEGQKKMTKKKKKKDEARFVKITVAYEGMTTAAMLDGLSQWLQVPHDDLNVISHTFNTDVAVTQTVCYTHPDSAGSARPNQKALSTVLGSLRAALAGKQVAESACVTAADVDLSGSTPLPYRGSFFNTARDRSGRQGSLAVLAYAASERPLVPADLGGYRTDVLLRDVRQRVGAPRGAASVAQLQENLRVVAKEGALNLVPGPLGAGRDGLGWVDVGCAAANGNYKKAVSRTVQQMAALHPDVAAVLEKVLAARATQRQAGDSSTFRSEDELEDGVEGPEDVEVSGRGIMRLIDELPPEVAWVGDLITVTLTDTGLNRFKHVWQAAVPPHAREAILRAPVDHVWNKLAVERLVRYGPYPVKGDLVRTQLGAVKVLKTDEEARQTPPSAVVLPYPEVSRGPLWHQSTLFPAHGISQAAFEICLKQTGLTPHLLHPNDTTRDRNWVPYRPLVVRPFDVRAHDVSCGDDETSTTTTTTSSSSSSSPSTDGSTLRLHDPLMASPVARYAYYGERLVLARGRRQRLPPGAAAATPHSGSRGSDATAREAARVAFVPGRVLSAERWAALLGRAEAPRPPAPTPLYAEAWVCATCEAVNHPRLQECAHCVGAYRMERRRDAEAEEGRVEVAEEGSSFLDMSQGTRHVKVTLVTAPAVRSVEAMLSEACDLHNFSGYLLPDVDPEAVQLRSLTNLLSIV